MVADAERLGSRAVGIWPPPGAMSKDRVAIVGRGQVAFLFGGANSYYASYSAQGSDCAEGWLTYCDQIQRRLADRGVTFDLVIVPNKATLLPHHYPLDLGRAITDPLARIEAARPSWLLSVLDRFRSDPAPEEIFRRNDSHLTSHGNVVLCESIIEQLGYSPTVDFRALPVTEITHVGDLGYRFDPPVAEVMRRLRLAPQGVEIEQIAAAKGAHVGLSFSIFNPHAVLDKTVAVFGNSFFERYEGWGVTPFFSRYFRRVFFEWSNKVDFAVIERLQPQHVVIQTCERFLRTWPSVTPS